MKTHEQTWWDKEIKDHFLEFKSWVGDKNAPSKVWAREFVKLNKFESLVDIGCGNATEYFAYKEEYPELKYTGVDSSKFLNEFNIAKGVPMVLANADKTRLVDSSSDVAFSRHVLEHQESPYPILDEMIRVGKKVAIHVFFIKPGLTEYIHFDEKQNLFHNTFKKKDLEDHISDNEKVDNFIWVDVSDREESLVIFLK